MSRLRVWAYLGAFGSAFEVGALAALVVSGLWWAALPMAAEATLVFWGTERAWRRWMAAGMP